jgi:hypothetical protein
MSVNGMFTCLKLMKGGVPHVAAVVTTPSAIEVHYVIHSIND